MSTLPEGTSRVAFGLYEADLNSQELWRAGNKVRLQGQPFKVLRGLLVRPGEVVSREDLQRQVWGENTTVDFDHSLGIAVNKLREALRDSADNPQYVETLSRRGYRFIAPVTVLEGAAEMAVAEPVGAAAAEMATVPPVILVPEASGARSKRRARLLTAGLVAGALALGGGLGAGWGRFVGNSGFQAPRRVDELTHNARIFPGAPNMESLPVLATDGVRVFTSILVNGRAQLSSIEIHGGEVQRLALPSEIADSTLGDLSRDGSKLLMRSHTSPESEQPVWVVPTDGGSALRVENIVAHDAVWMPDGSAVLYASGNDLAVVRLRDGQVTRYASLPGRAFWMRWSPDGRLLRFTLLDPISHTSALWEMASDKRAARPLLKGWSDPAAECCGTWTADGRYFIFQASHGVGTDLWELNGDRSADPVKLTNGPLEYGSPLAARAGHRIYFLGLATDSEVERFDRGLNSFVAERGFLADASRVSYSRDGRWVAWTDQAGRLWRARADDGAEKLQLTPDSMQVFLAHWSPDGRQLAIMARESGRAWQVSVIPADGGTPETLLKENRNEGDPDWSADGRQIVFGRVPDMMGKEGGSHAIEVLDLASRTVTTLPGSEGLFSPRWSPDGRWIAALSSDQNRLLVFDTVSRAWRAVREVRAADPVWSRDSRAVFVHNDAAGDESIDRVTVPGGETETVAKLIDLRVRDKADYYFVGVTPEGVPLVRVRSATGNLYTLDLDAK